MRYCRNCGSVVKDDQIFCSNCGARCDGQSNVPPQQDTGVPNYGQQTYSSPPRGPRKDNTAKTLIIIGAVGVVIVLLAAFILPNFIVVEQTADYTVKMDISNVSITDTDNGFQYAEKDSSGRLHAYILYRCNGSSDRYHELGWCRTDGTKMVLDDSQRTLTFDVVSQQSKIQVSVFLVVVTKIVDGQNHYDYADLYDVTSYIQGEKPTGDHNYGVTGVSFNLSELDTYQTVLKGDSNPKGTVTLTFTVIKK